MTFAGTFGTEGSIGAVLDDGRIVVLDPLPAPHGAVATVLTRNAALELQLVAQEVRPELVDLSRAAAVAVGGSRFALLAAPDVILFDVDSAGHVTELSRATDALPGAYMTAPALVAFGDVWYACSVGHDEGTILDASNPAAIAVVGPMPPFGSCAGLTIDHERERLITSAFSFNGSQGGLVRFSLADPRAPTEIDRARVDESTLAATNGAVIAVANPSSWSGSNFVTLLDAGDLHELTTIDAGGSAWSDSFGELLFDGDRLFAQDQAGLSAWDVSNPSSPSLLFRVEGSGVNNASNPPPMNALRTDGVTLLRSGEGVYGSAALLVDVAGSEALPLEHPALGGLSRLVRGAGAVTAFDRTSIHLVDDGDQDDPRFLAGSRANSQEAAASLWSLGVAGAPPRFLAAAQTPGVFTSAYDSRWRDGSDPADALALTAPFTPFQDGSVVHVVDDGARAFSVDIDFEGATATLATWDLTALDPAGIAPGFVASTRLPLPSTGTLSSHYATVAVAGDRVVAVTTDDLDDLFDETVVATSHVFLVDVASEAPVVLASATLSGFVLSASVDGDRIALVVKTSGSLCCGSFNGEVVRSMRRSGAALVMEGDAALLEAGRLLRVDDDAALVTTSRGLAFVSLGAAGPNVDGELELPEPPLSAISVGDRLWLGGPHGISVVSPPCPAE